MVHHNRKDRRTKKPDRHFRIRYRTLAVVLLFGLVLFAAFKSEFLNATCRSRARDALAKRHWDAAEWWLRRASLLSREDWQTDFLWARLDRKLGRTEAMMVRLDQARDLGGDPEVLTRELWFAKAEGGDLSDLESHLSELLAEGTEAPEVAEAYVRGCLQTYRLGDARKLLDIWQSDAPDDPCPPFLRGRIVEHQGSLDTSEQEYREALRRDPRYAPAAYSLGRILLAKQMAEEALLFYERAAENLYDPQPGEVGAARCLREMGRHQDARSRLTKAAKSASDRVEIAYRLVGESGNAGKALLAAEWGQLELAEKKWSGAERWLTKALEANPRDWRLRYSLGIALRQQGKLEAAQREMEAYNETREKLATCDRLIDELQGDPTNAEARFGVGKVLLDYVSEQQGVIWLNSVLQYEPTHTRAHELLADYYGRHVGTNPAFAALAKHHQEFVDQVAEPDR